MRRMFGNRRIRPEASDWALLYLRLFLGGFVLLRNICKICEYNEIVDLYPPLLYVSGSAAFVFAMLVEVSMALLLMIGFRVRFAAALLAGMAFVALAYTLPAENVERMERLFVTVGILLALVIGGGGVLSLDNLRLSDFSTRKNQ